MKSKKLIYADADGIIRNKERYYLVAWTDPKSYGKEIGRDYSTLKNAQRAADYYMKHGNYSNIMIRNEYIIKRGPGVELSADSPKKELYNAFYAERLNG